MCLLVLVVLRPYPTPPPLPLPPLPRPELLLLAFSRLIYKLIVNKCPFLRRRPLNPLVAGTVRSYLLCTYKICFYVAIWVVGGTPIILTVLNSCSQVLYRILDNGLILCFILFQFHFLFFLFFFCVLFAVLFVQFVWCTSPTHFQPFSLIPFPPSHQTFGVFQSYFSVPLPVVFLFFYFSSLFCAGIQQRITTTTTIPVVLLPPPLNQHRQARHQVSYS